MMCFISFQHLPDVFRGMKFYVPDTIEDRAVMCRYIIAYPLRHLLFVFRRFLCVAVLINVNESTPIVVGQRFEIYVLLPSVTFF